MRSAGGGWHARQLGGWHRVASWAGWRRVAGELTLVAVFLLVYEEIRWHMVQAGGAAASHALSVVSAERAIGLFHEQAVQAVFTPGTPSRTRSTRTTGARTSWSRPSRWPGCCCGIPNTTPARARPWR